MNNDIATDPRAIVDILARDGVVKIDGFLAQDALKAIRAELETVRASLGEVPTPPPQRGPSLYPTSMLVHGRLREISEISRVLTSPTLGAVRKFILGWDSYVSDIVGIESLPEHKIVTQWHVDGTLDCIASPGNTRIKLFFYLNDVTSRNGAFSYVPGSQKLLDTLHRRMHDGKLDAVSIRDLSTLREYFADHSPALPEDLQEVADEMFSGIESDTAPCGPYSLEGPAGTLIVFDERGMHRGGDISEGQRSILRISLRRERVTSVNDAIRVAIRKTARLCLPGRYAKLM